jgi:potassium voltage-gated channel Eag-related subfamily H protein 7
MAASMVGSLQRQGTQNTLNGLGDSSPSARQFDARGPRQPSSKGKVSTKGLESVRSSYAQSTPGSAPAGGGSGPFAKQPAYKGNNGYARARSTEVQEANRSVPLAEMESRSTEPASEQQKGKTVTYDSSTKDEPKSPKSPTSPKSNASSRSITITYQEPRFLIHPEKNCITPKWDKLIMLALVYVALWTPYEVGLMTDKAKAQIWWLKNLNYAIDMLFGFDILLQFFLMYETRTNTGYTWIKDRKKIAKHYLRGWFIIDIVSVFPFDLAASIAMGEGNSNLRLVKVIRAIRLLKLARVLRAGRILGRLQANSSMSMQYLEMVFLFIKMILAGHWMACIWGFVGVFGYDYTVPVEEQDPTTSWIASTDPQNLGGWDSHFALWSVGFQWSIQTLTSIGYGESLPVNQFEHIMNVILMMVLAMVWVRTLGTMTAYMTTLISGNLKLYETLDDLNSLMDEHGLPKDLKRNARMYFRTKVTCGTRGYFDFIREMSPFLRNKVVKFANAHWIENAYFLKPVSELHEFSAFMGELSVRFRLELYSKGEPFGEWRTFYLINNGLVAKRGKVMRRAGVFGEDVLLTCSALAEEPRAMSLIYTEVWSLSHHEFYYVLDAEEYEAERVLIRRYTVKLSVIRGLIKEAKRRKELGITTTIKEEMAQEAAANPVVVLDGSLQADILNDLCGVQDRLGKVHETLGKSLTN